jgi:hypothetical protein
VAPRAAEAPPRQGEGGMSSTELIRYDAMCQAIAAAYEVDEVKDIRDKARAIEVYAQQALNTEAEQQACEIRLWISCSMLVRAYPASMFGGLMFH